MIEHIQAAGLILILFLGFVICFLFLFYDRHTWVYRNPHDRSCSVCGRHEVEHSFRMEAAGWWEVFDPGDPSKHHESP